MSQVYVILLAVSYLAELGTKILKLCSILNVEMLMQCKSCSPGGISA